MTLLTDVERETVTRALKHYQLQCEIWRDASGVVGIDNEGMWALMIERLASCLNKIAGKGLAVESLSQTPATLTMIGRDGSKMEYRRAR